MRRASRKLLILNIYSRAIRVGWYGAGRPSSEGGNWLTVDGQREALERSIEVRSSVTLVR